MISWSSQLSLSSDVFHTWKKLRSWVECLLEAFTAQGKSVFVIIFDQQDCISIYPEVLGGQSREVSITQAWQDCLKKFNRFLCDSFLKADMRENPCAQGCPRSQDCIWPVCLLLRMNSHLFQGHQICNSIPAAPQGSLHKAYLFRLCVGWGLCYPTAQKWWLLQNRDLFFIEMCCPPGAVAVCDTATHKKSKWGIVWERLCCPKHQSQESLSTE